MRPTKLTSSSDNSTEKAGASRLVHSASQPALSRGAENASMMPSSVLEGLKRMGTASSSPRDGPAVVPNSPSTSVHQSKGAAGDGDKPGGAEQALSLDVSSLGQSPRVIGSLAAGQRLGGPRDGSVMLKDEDRALPCEGEAGEDAVVRGALERVSVKMHGVKPNMLPPDLKARLASWVSGTDMELLQVSCWGTGGEDRPGR